MRARTRYAFGLSGLADNVIGTFLGVHLFVFYTDVVGLSALYVSAGLTVALIWNAFSDFFMGRISDRTRWAGRASTALHPPSARCRWVWPSCSCSRRPRACPSPSSPSTSPWSSSASSP
jgi:hypothetical protein